MPVRFKLLAAVSAAVCSLLVASVSASASEVVFITRATESHAVFVSDSNGVTTQIEILSVEHIGVSKGAPVDDKRTLIFVTSTNDISGQQDFLFGFTFDTASVSPNLQSASWGPETVNVTSFGFNCCTPQPITLTASWSANGAAQHDHMLNFFCPPGTCFGMFNLVGTSQPANVSFSASGFVDGVDLSQLSWTQTVGTIDQGTGVGVFG